MLNRSWLVAAACGAVLAAPAAAQAVPSTPIPGQYIVVLKAGASGRAVAAEHARSAHAHVLQTYDAAVHGYTARLSTAGLAEVKRDPRVSYVTQDVEGKPLDSQTTPTGVARVVATGDTQYLASASTTSTTTSSTTGNVAVYDTGIDLAHPDLNVAGGVDCLDSTDAYNDGTYNDSYGHGTHVAGIIGAKNDGVGVVGVDPGVRLWSVRDLDSMASGTKSSQLCGINWITQNGPALGIKVVNSSQGLFGSADDGNCGNSVGDVLHQAICASTQAGINWVFAAGNTAGAFDKIAGPGWPEVLSVTAMSDSNGQPNVGSTQKFSCGSAINFSGPKTSEVDDTYGSFSKYASAAAVQAHTVAAPGACIWSTFKGQSYGYLTGTSMAAPHVAGVVEACVLDGKCSGTTAQTIQQIRSDAATYNTAHTLFGFKGDPLRPVKGEYFGYLVRADLY